MVGIRVVRTTVDERKWQVFFCREVTFFAVVTVEIGDASVVRGSCRYDYFFGVTTRVREILF